MTPARRQAVERFAEAVAHQPIDLGEAALCLALTEEPELDLDPWRNQLDVLGRALAERLPPDGSPRARLDALRGFLFGELGLMGNEDDYYAAENSYLHQVLLRGLGIPISLSVITLEVGRRAGLELFGVGFPAHFLVGAEGGVYLDPFHQGRILSEADCAQLLLQLTGGSIPFRPALLEPATTRSILLRMLRNLKGAHLRSGDLELALLDIERVMLLEPGAAERRDRGLIHMALKEHDDAVADFEAYLASDPPDADAVRDLLAEAKRKASA